MRDSGGAGAAFPHERADVLKWYARVHGAYCAAADALRRRHRAALA
ncbi:hypothetical protein BURMUCF2_2776 [Burkholderia multivorans CF2]|nr:hypothetical protein BURMUCF2_2776 [Burkholderia multivorans CF2]